MSDKGKVVNESRCGNAFMKIVDRSDGENFKLTIESNVLKKYNFTTNVSGNKLAIAGEYEEKIGGTVNTQKMSYDYFLPNDVDPSKIKTTETENQMQLEAPRSKK